MIPEGWRRVPLSSISNRVARRNSIGNTNVLTISAKHGLVNQKEFFNKYVSSENVSNYFLLNKGEFAYNKSYSAGYPVGVVRKLKLYDVGVLSPLYICFNVQSDDVDSVYTEHFFDSQWFISEINQIAKEGARNHGLLNVGVGDFFNLEFVLPPLPEQKKIAAFLTSVDEAIEKQGAQIAKLQSLKKAMMQELLTQGIGHTEFKDSPVGRIPNGWEVKPLVNLSVDGINNGEFKDPKKVGRGYRLINVFDLYQQFGLEYENLELLAIDQKAFAKKKVENMVMCFLLALHLSWRESLIAM